MRFIDNILNYIKKYRVFLIGLLAIIFSFLPFLIRLLIQFSVITFRYDDSELISDTDAQNANASIMGFLFGSNIIFLFVGFLIVTIIVLTITLSYAKNHDMIFSSKPIGKTHHKSISHSSVNYISSTKTTKTSRELLEVYSSPTISAELTCFSDEFLNKVDLFDWETNEIKSAFLKEMLGLIPEERKDVLNYMFEKASQSGLKLI